MEKVERKIKEDKDIKIALRGKAGSCVTSYHHC